MRRTGQIASLAIIAIGVGVYIFDPPQSQEPEQEAEAASDPLMSARYACREFIAPMLHDPGSVEWVSWTQWAGFEREDGSFYVAVDLRAKNAMGALVLQEVDCNVRRDGDRWFLIDASI